MRVSLSYKIDTNIDDFCHSYWDKAFVRSKFEAQGATNIEIAISDGPDGARIVTSNRDVPMEVPAMLQAIIGERSAVRQTESWTGSEGGPYRCKIEVEPQGVPASAKGEIVVSRIDNGCLLECETDAICTMPIVGRMAENSWLQI